MAFVEMESTEIITIDEEIRVVGLSLQKSDLPISFASLGQLWEIYGRNYRGKISNMQVPVVEYGICLNKVPDYITGCSVSEIAELKGEFSSFIIPKGQYIKDMFNAESHEKLTNDAMGKRNVKAWAKKNKVKIDSLFTIEVYPTSEFEKGNFQMYTLTPIKE